MLNLISLLIPLREAFGIRIYNIPFRIGELIIPIIILIGIVNIKNTKNTKKRNKYVEILLGVLLLNFILTCIVSLIHINEINKAFFIKYIIRNFVYFVFLLVFYTNIQNYKEINFKQFIKYIIYIEGIFYILEAFNIYIYFCKIMQYSTNKTSIFIESIIRFCGTASEPGYLAPILILPVCYFSSIHKKNISDIIHYIASILLVTLTFSAFVYISMVLIIVLNKIKYFYENKSRIKINRKIAILIIIITLITVGVITYVGLNENSKLSKTVNFIIKKVNCYLFLDTEETEDYSSKVRKLNYEYAKNMFKDSNFLEKIIGNGTGAYSYSVENEKKYGNIIEISEEAHSLYYSTITDRGLIGIIVLGIIIYSVFKLRVNTIESNTIFASILIQLLQFFIVGNMWVYFMWFEIALLIYYNYQYYKQKELILEDIDEKTK